MEICSNLTLITRPQDYYILKSTSPAQILPVRVLIYVLLQGCIEDW